MNETQTGPCECRIASTSYGFGIGSTRPRVAAGEPEIVYCSMHRAASAMLETLDGLVGNGFTDEELARRYGQTVDRIRAARAAIAQAEGK